MNTPPRTPIRATVRTAPGALSRREVAAVHPTRVAAAELYAPVGPARQAGAPCSRGDATPRCATNCGPAFTGRAAFSYLDAVKKKETGEAAALLRSLLSYEPDTGLIRWAVDRRSVKAGTVAGCKNPRGYVVIGVLRTGYCAHRVAWLFITGHWPDEEIDHLNGDRSDNRACNLREARRVQNMRNRPVQKCSTSGFKGVCWNKSNQNWQARIRVGDKRLYLGSFSTAELAFDAYCRAARKHHGDFVHHSVAIGTPATNLI